MTFQKIILNRKLRPIFVYSSIVLLIVLFILIFSEHLVSMIFTFMLLLLGSLSSAFKKMFGVDVGLEFITFSTILFLYSHGFIFALVACIIMIFISSLIRGQFGLGTITGFGMYVVIGLLSLTFDFGIVWNGIILVLFMNLVGLIILFLVGSNVIKTTIYIIVNTIFNILLFLYFSPVIFSLL
jgi:hypothetical protein